MAAFTGVSDEELFTRVVDYGSDYPNGVNRSLRKVSYAELKSGEITLKGQKVQTVPLSSVTGAREIAGKLKAWIQGGDFLLGEAQHPIPG
jgi:uncharacterized protein (DUF39 family)